MFWGHGMYIAARAPCDEFDPWVRWERGQVGISEFAGRRRRLGIWKFGNLGTWKSRILEIREPGNLEILKSVTWKSGDLGSEEKNNSKMTIVKI